MAGQPTPSPNVPPPPQPEIANTDETWADEKPSVSLNYMDVS